MVSKKCSGPERTLWIMLKPGEVQPALKRRSSRVLFIQTECTTQKEAERLLADAERWSKVRDE